MLDNPKQRRGTSTSSFGVSKREGHDSSTFYDRFTTPAISTDMEISPSKTIDDVFCHDARYMPEIDDKSVALVITSPPYFAGKEYELAIGEGHVPGSYRDYLIMLEEVFAECVRKLEPGGRLAINVANLGRKPYRSLSSDVTHILQDRLKLLLRGEVIWLKAKGAGGSCAWGSFQRPANPVLRDLTERVIIASKGRFDRAVSARQRLKNDLPSEASIFRDEFMEATTDVWEIPAESASRVGHPAPFPVELPERLINLYTYRNDLILDPFIGSGTTAVAAVRCERHFAGYDTEPTYVAAAKQRIEVERVRVQEAAELDQQPLRVVLPGEPAAALDDEDFQARAVREGRAARDLALQAIRECGFIDIRPDVKFPQGVEVNFQARDKLGGIWNFDVSGGFTSSRPGLRRTDTLWKALGKAGVLTETSPGIPLVLLTTNAPAPGSAGDAALEVMKGKRKPIRDVIVLNSEDDLLRLRQFAVRGAEDTKS